MLNNKTVAVVVPAYNEETQIGMVIETMPKFVDRIIIINDKSTDNTKNVVLDYFKTEHNDSSAILEQPDLTKTYSRYDQAEKIVDQIRAKEEELYPEFSVIRDNKNSRIVLLDHAQNYRKGGGIISGYKWCRDNHIDCIASMDGDGQMDPSELESLCSPVVYEGVDYVKGNRLIHKAAYMTIPKTRSLGNSILSILTKIASGYWRVSDTQTGYNVISLSALESIHIHKIYRDYGYPNDMLVKLNISYCSIRDVEIKPVYNVGEQSKMKIHKVIPKVSWLLIKLFFKRLWVKYLFRDFHPLFLLYHFSFVLLLTSMPYAYKLISIIFAGEKAGPLPVLAFFFLFTTGVQFLFFAMWMDMHNNEILHK